MFDVKSGHGPFDAKIAGVSLLGKTSRLGDLDEKIAETSILNNLAEVIRCLSGI